MLEDLKKPIQQRPCRTRAVLESMAPNDYDILITALNDLAWTSRQLSIELRRLGVTLSRDSIDRHRTKSCSCNEGK
jgi:hypothetical protein